jgi:3-dehydro-L-gulonate 2-dehydrogenase
MAERQRVAFDQLVAEFHRVLRRSGFSESGSTMMARILAESTRDGVHSHGVNRFPVFIESVRNGTVMVDAKPVKLHVFGGFERWDGGRGAGILNANFSMARAIALAGEHGIGCVALRNTNHWMRGGTYGLQAAAAGCIGICWSNTMALMPPWGGREVKVGNNPLIIAIPHGTQNDEAPLLFDGSMSQFSMGRVLNAARAGEQLPADGGYDDRGQPTRDARQIAHTRQLLPMGLWKGSGLAIMLDAMGAVLADGKTTPEITALPHETDMTQVFIAADLARIAPDEAARRAIVERLLEDLNATEPFAPGEPVMAPGQRMAERRRQSDREGIFVDAEIWRQVQAL